jgi:hypothetical protein
MSLEPWKIASEQPPAWFGDVSASELEEFRGLAKKLRVHELWFSEASRTLTGSDGILGVVGEGESVQAAFRRVLQEWDERQLAEREAARDRKAETSESLKRFRGKPGGSDA